MSFIYQTRINQFSIELKKYKNASRNLSFSRLLVFALIVAGTYLYWGQAIPIALFVIGGGIIFLRLVVLNTKADNQVEYLKALIQINENENLATQNNYVNPENGEEFLHQSHEYAQDFDLFGRASFFERFNRTVTIRGRNTFAGWLLNPSLQGEEIVEKQSAVKELVTKLDWRQEFLASGMLNQITVKDEKRIIDWHEYESSLTNKIWLKPILWLIPFISCLMLVSSVFGWIGWTQFGYYLMVPLGLVGSQLKSINKESSIFSNLVTKFEVLANLTQKVENENFDTRLLNDWKDQLLASDKKVASQKITELKHLLAKFEQRNNMLIGIVLNALLLWDLQMMFRMNQWKNENSLELNSWISVLGKFDAIISIANLAYNNSKFVFPHISNKEFEVSGINVKHPMLDSSKAIGNDYQLSHQGSIHIVTGANMAGKSTFLRTIGLNMILGMMGAPVSAEKFSFSPMKIFSSMRTEDSLAEQTSFFYAELSRLAKISEILKTGEKRFVILDEILKGTNSVDKARGSYAFVEKIINYNMMGIIATHDLSLCELGNKYPDKIKNKSFEVEFENEELVFDYKLHDRICKNMNASFLLKKMGIVDHY